MIDYSAFESNPIDEIELPESLQVINSSNFIYTIAKNIPTNIKIGVSNFVNQDLGNNFVASYDVYQLKYNKSLISPTIFCDWRYFMSYLQQLLEYVSKWCY